MTKIGINLKNNPYSIYIVGNLANKLNSCIKSLNLGNFAIIITSAHILRLYKSLVYKIFSGKNFKIIVVPDGEAAKSQKSFLLTLEQIVKSDGLNKKPFIICFGGGTIGDLGGFVASVYKRGIPYIQVPTTLLSQIDASIGGKTAIDLKAAKNIVGTFYQPKAVFIAPDFLKTLSPKELKEGMAEAIKYAIIRGGKFFEFLYKNKDKIMACDTAVLLKVITACVALKARIVEKDELEKKGIRTILNLGHTFAHALEASFKYKKLTHGQAVSLGMLFAAKLSINLKKTSFATLKKIEKIITAYGLPSKIHCDFSYLQKALIYDKKFINGKLRLVLIERIGKVKVCEDITFVQIKKALKYFN